MTQLALSVAAPSGPYDLAALGTLDWFVYPGSATPVKKSGAGYLSTVSHTILPGGATFTDNTYTGGTTLAWSGGTPTVSGSSTGGIFAYSGGALNPREVGYVFTAPADTTVRTLRVFVSTYSAALKITVSISDASTAAQVYEEPAYTLNTSKYNTVEIQYAAASAGQTITVTVGMGAQVGANRNVGLQGAALSGSAPSSGGITVTGVTVSPSTATVSGGATQQFTASVAGANSPSQSVTWTASIGTISTSGLWTAPAATTSAQTATITAKSVQDTTKTGTATATVAAAVATTRTVTVTLELAKDVPAANLTGGMLSFYDEQTPNLFGTPRYQTGAATTNASGVMTWTCQTMLGPGQKGGYVLRFADGKHFNGLALVS